MISVSGRTEILIYLLLNSVHLYHCWTEASLYDQLHLRRINIRFNILVRDCFAGEVFCLHTEVIYIMVFELI